MYIIIFLVVFVVYPAILNIALALFLEYRFKKLAGDAQQIKTAQRGSKKRELKLLKEGGK